jgi:two-component system, cell cycle sensor histidine kinase and response regulator CckA
LDNERENGQDFEAMGRTILLIEDDEHALGMMATVLTKQGHEVFQAKDGSEAQNHWSDPNRKFDLLIADVKLPGDEDGFMLAERLLESRPEVPVMFISGDRDCFASPSIRAFGDSPFIAKPFNVKQMIAAVDQVLSKAGGSNK